VLHQHVLVDIALLGGLERTEKAGERLLASMNTFMSRQIFPVVESLLTIPTRQARGIALGAGEWAK